MRECVVHERHQYKHSSLGSERNAGYDHVIEKLILLTISFSIKRIKKELEYFASDNAEHGFLVRNKMILMVMKLGIKSINALEDFL